MKWLKYIFFGVLGYLAHLSIESFILTNVLAKFGLSIPIYV